jgi:hypothetical protein
MVIESGGTSPELLLGILVGLIVLALLVFVLVLLYLRRQEGKPGEAGRRKRRRAAPPVVATAPPPEELTAPELEDSARPGEVMRVIRDPGSGRVAVEVEGRRYEHLREIEEAQVGRRVLWAIADLVRFTGGIATNTRAVRSASEAAAREGEGLAPVSPGSAEPLPDTGGDGSSPMTVAQSVSAFFWRGLEAPPSSAAMPAASSLIDQVEILLQAEIADLEEPLPYPVHVSAGLEQRLQIQVGEEVYGSVEEVPAPEARAVLQAAVAKWEGSL